MISDRKLEHLMLCRNNDVEYRKKTGFEDIELIHKALPEVNKEEIDVKTEFFGKKMDAPIIISAITGGHPASLSINRELAKAAGKLNIGMGVGSQRAAVENPELTPTYTVVREEAPSSFLIGNIGAPQIEYAQKAADMMDADALALHLNPLQEAIQPEGDVDATGYTDSIKEISKTLKLPVIAKETGAGINSQDARTLEKAGVSAVDVAGSGGTSWAAVETYRAKDRYLGNLYWDWGIPTAISTVEVCESIDLPVISSGGIRTGLDAAKAIALGADAVGLALPLLKDAYSGHEAVITRLEKFVEELKVAMFLVGASSLEELRNSDIIIKGSTKEWLQERGFNTKKYARRSVQ
ncbi:type 2 isopentenyl-diphosphate Delta-isomerase [Methanobacterium aggregans]|uniref:type 2 isopentenyl-diphosphate Delta-isomerase n=1 Tax=Methanobacterium aggregans TaxID=1615586 RepID=UPI001AE6F046|nr:type 2 isopentenyl-diphosphate Delta-isomerase [Methanobacterium aggregans]MBP2044941.1 isopentenyl-diphosphate delta-isomerase [Methanobacterium aggregans]